MSELSSLFNALGSWLTANLWQVSIELFILAAVVYGVIHILLVNTFAAAESNLASRVRLILAGKKARMSVGLSVASAVALGAVAVFGLPGALEPGTQTAGDSQAMAEVAVPDPVPAEAGEPREVVEVSASLQALIDAAGAGDVVRVPRGVHTEPLTIDKPITLRGVSATESVLDITSDDPGISITSEGPVTIDGLTIRYQRKTSDRRDLPSCAVGAKDSKTVIENCRFIAKGNFKRSPCAFYAYGFCDASIRNCRFDGFEFTIQYADGAKGSVTDCAVLNPGHCGITVGNDCTVEIHRNIVTGARYHGVRCTGGALQVRDNLIIANKNRGIYLGNKSATGEVSNNVITGNATGISGFANSAVKISRNVIVDSTFAALDFRGTCGLEVEGNVLAGNDRGMVLFSEDASMNTVIGRNTFWKNKMDTEHFELPEKALALDPMFKASERGDFGLGQPMLNKEKQGLSEAAVLRSLWTAWQQAIREGG